MTEEERKDYLKYIENYTINDLADMFNTQNFVIQDKDKFNEILLYYHFKQNEEIEQLQKENKKYKEVIDKVIEEIKKELKENNHLSYGVALSIIVMLNYYEEILKEVE